MSEMGDSDGLALDTLFPQVSSVLLQRSPINY